MRKLIAVFVLALVGAFTTAGIAQATEPKLPHVVADVEDCETASLTFVNPRDYGVTFTYGDGLDVPLAAGEEVTKELGFAAKSGHHTVAYKVSKSPESDDRAVAGSVMVDCLTDVTPAAPTAVDGTCDKSGTIVITRTEGVRYKLDGEHIGKGTNAVEPGTYEVTAHARPGYELVGKSSWTLTVAVDCPDPSESPSTPPSESPSEPPASPSEPPATTPAGNEPPTDLPVTGTALMWLLTGGAGLLASGAGALWLARRRFSAL